MTIKIKGHRLKLNMCIQHIIFTNNDVRSHVICLAIETLQQ